jgi:tRNA G46 methylase TrmB
LPSSIRAYIQFPVPQKKKKKRKKKVVSEFFAREQLFLELNLIFNGVFY